MIKTLNDDRNPYEVVLKNGQVLNMYIYDQMKLQVELLKDRMTEKERVLERLLAEKDLAAAKTNEILGWKNRPPSLQGNIQHSRCAGVPSQGHPRKPSNDNIEDCRPIQRLLDI